MALTVPVGSMIYVSGSTCGAPKSLLCASDRQARYVTDLLGRLHGVPAIMAVVRTESHHHHTIAVIVRERLQERHLSATRLAPARPEIQHHDLAAQRR